MKLVHSRFTNPIIWTETDIPVIVFEHAIDFRELTSELYQQVENGDDGNFVYSQATTIDLHKNCQIIMNPLVLATSNKAITQAVLKHMERLANEENQLTISILAEIQRYMRQLCDEALIPLTFNEDLSIIALIKQCGVQIDLDGETLIEQIMAYVRALNCLTSSHTFIFVQFKSYFADDELKEFYDFVIKEKVSIVLIEHVSRKRLNYEKYFIVDQDHCELFE